MVRNRNKAGKILSKYRLEVPLSDAHQISIARCHAQVFKRTNNKKWRREKEQGSAFQEQGCDQATAPSDGLPPSYASKPHTLCRGK